jgi:hypothetical protein
MHIYWRLSEKYMLLSANRTNAHHWFRIFNSYDLNWVETRYMLKMVKRGYKVPF